VLPATRSPSRGGARESSRHSQGRFELVAGPGEVGDRVQRLARGAADRHRYGMRRVEDEVVEAETLLTGCSLGSGALVEGGQGLLTELAGRDRIPEGEEHAREVGPQHDGQRVFLAEGGGPRQGDPVALPSGGQIAQGLVQQAQLCAYQEPAIRPPEALLGGQDRLAESIPARPETSCELPCGLGAGPPPGQDR